MKGGGSVARKDERFDIFICHASEDKESIARPLTKLLYQSGYNVFLDELVIKMGDSISDRINKALWEANYCVVIISEALFSKPWAITELQSIINMNISKNKRILPIWHKISHTDVVRNTPLLSDVRAASSSDGIPSLVYQIKDAIGAPPKTSKRKTNFIWSFFDFNEAVQISILKNIVRGAADVDSADYASAVMDIRLFLDSLDRKLMSKKLLPYYDTAQAEIQLIIQKWSLD
jgi:hypothetical protein